MPSDDIAYGAICPHACYAIVWCYALSGTELAYGATDADTDQHVGQRGPGSRVCSTKSGTSLADQYVMCGTDIVGSMFWGTASVGFRVVGLGSSV
eukprot:672178-Rhodomonas_salina.1